MAIDTLRLAQGNNLSDTLSTSIGSTDTTIPVNTISIWSATGGKVIIDRGLSTQEIIYCSGVSGSSLVVQAGGRGQEGTTAQGHNVGAAVESVPTAGDWNDTITTLKNLFKTADGNIDITKLGTAQYVADTGSANAYVATLVPALASYTAGTIVAFKATNANTTASTLNVNALGTKTIKIWKGSTIVDLTANDILAGQLVVCVYDGTYFQMVSPSGSAVTLTDTQTLTNKRRTRRVVTTTQSATPTINTDNTDVAVITGLAQAITSFTTNLSGTPNDGDLLEIDITDNGTARALTFGASFKATTVALPTTTVISTKLNILFKWSAADSAWLCVASA